MSVILEKRAAPRLRFKEFVSNWKSSSFEELLIHSRLGGNYSNDENPNKNPLIKMGNLKRGNISLSKLSYVLEDETLDDKDLIKYGDLFFNTRNTLDLVGKVAIWRDELPRAFYNSNLMRLKFDNNFFMNYLFNSYNGIKSLRRLATGTTSVAAIYTRDLLKLKIVVPSINEQNKIAEFLSSVDKKIQLLDKKKEQLELYKKGIMQKIFSQEIRFKDDNGNNYSNWQERKLCDIAKIYQPKTISQADLTKDGYDVFGANGIIGKYHSFNHEFNQVVVTCRGSSCGTVNFTNPFSWITGNAMVINLDDSFDVNKKFLFFQLYNTDFTYLITGSGQPQITADIKSHKVLLPNLDEQKKIASFLSSIDKKIDCVSVQIEKTKEFKKGLLQQMFV